MDEVLIWALENEPRVFGGTLGQLRQNDSHAAFECVVLAAEEARKFVGDSKKQKAVLVRKTRNLYHDHLRRKYGVAKDEEGRRTYRFHVHYDSAWVSKVLDEERQAAPAQGLSWEALHPKVVHEAIRRDFTADEVRLFELTVEGESSEAIGYEMNLTSSAVRKRMERLRPALASCIADASGLKTDYVLLLLGGRNKAGASARCHAGRELLS